MSASRPIPLSCIPTLATSHPSNPLSYLNSTPIASQLGSFSGRLNLGLQFMIKYFLWHGWYQRCEICSNFLYHELNCDNQLFSIDFQGFQLRKLCTIEMFGSIEIFHGIRIESSQNMRSPIGDGNRLSRKGTEVGMCFVGWARWGRGGPPWEGSAPPLSGRHTDVTTVGNVLPHHRRSHYHPG